MDPGNSNDASHTIQLYIYDLTKGMARMMSSLFLGKQIEGVWHTSIVAYGKEYFYGNGGIQCCNPSGTVLGDPDRVEKLGSTFIPYQVFLDYILGLGETTFKGEYYSLFEHNCNNFTDDLANFLCGVGIPKHILALPQDVLNTPLGQSLKPLIDSLGTGTTSVVSGVRHNREESPDFLSLNTQIEEARLQSLALEERRSNLSEKIARKERKKEKKRKKQGQDQLGSYHHTSSSDLSNSGNPNMADTVSELNGEPPSPDLSEFPSQQPGLDRPPTEQALEMEAEERREEEERRRQRDPPIVFKNLEANDVFDRLIEAISPLNLSSDDQQNVDELHQYLVQGEGSWALGDTFLNFVGNILNDKSLPSEARVTLLRVLACAALRDDVILVLHQDRRDHTLMNFAFSIDQIPLEEQKALALFICNLFENVNASEWLLYISEWQLGTQQISNIRVSTKVAVHSLLSEDKGLNDIGSAVMHNLACKEKMHQGKTLRRMLPRGCISKVFDDVAVELTMAILQQLSLRPEEEPLFRCLKALARFCQVSNQDVPQLIQMIGPPPASFKGASPRIDEQIEAISRKLR